MKQRFMKTENMKTDNARKAKIITFLRRKLIAVSFLAISFQFRNVMFLTFLELSVFRTRNKATTLFLFRKEIVVSFLELKMNYHSFSCSIGVPAKSLRTVKKLLHWRTNKVVSLFCALLRTSTS